MTWAVWKSFCVSILHCTSIKASDPPTLEEVSRDCGKVFTFMQIDEFSEGFSNLIGETSYHKIYKGVLADGTEVAIKAMKTNAPNVRVRERDFSSQRDLLSRIHHQNLANLIGFCEEKHHRMLILEYASNGTLFNNLHNDDEPISWKQRMRVAIGIASVLAYLHHSCGPPIIHGDLTSHNVLLTEDFNAKVCGISASLHLGSVQTMQRAQSGSESNGNACMVPSDDVYSFGVILLELISRKSAVTKEQDINIEWAIPYLQSRDQMTNLVDPAMKNVVPLELYAVCEIARLCIQREAASRPRMGEVHYMLVQSIGMESESGAPGVASNQ